MYRIRFESARDFETSATTTYQRFGIGMQLIGILCTSHPTLQEGRPLLELPEKHIDLVMLNFSKDEREVNRTDYGSFRTRNTELRYRSTII